MYTSVWGLAGFFFAFKLLDTSFSMTILLTNVVDMPHLPLESSPPRSMRLMLCLWHVPPANQMRSSMSQVQEPWGAPELAGDT